MAIALDYSRFYRYEEIKAFLQQCVDEYPHLAQLESIGKSYEGRDIWMLELTHRSSGEAADKPAMYIDANIHAGEVTGSHVCLHTILHLLAGYGTDTEVTHLLDTRAFYLIPRINPDGAELYLTTPHLLRSSVRPYPVDQDEQGIVMEDVNDDGLILQMRISDPAGEWKISSQDPRLMVRRQPDDFQGEFYRVVPEGRWQGDQREPLTVAPSRWGLDINRNFPAYWRPEQRGAGPYPLSEPETKAMADFFVSRPNIATVQAYHTTGGVIFRAYCTKSDDEMDQHDLKAFRALGQRGEEILGYKCIPASHGGWGSTRAGIFIDWVYEHRGLIGFTTELWDMAGRAGLDKDKEDKDKTLAHEEEEGLKLLKWQDEHLDGEGFRGWQPFDHPDLGTVEIGGWLTKTVRQNAPPGPLLEEECQKNCTFSLKHALATPLLRLEQVEGVRVGDGVFKVSARVRNMGYLPTGGTAHGAKTGLAKKPVAELKVPPEAKVVGGQARSELDHLPGFVEPGAVREQYLEWLVSTRAPCEIDLVVRSERAGTVRERVFLE